MQPTTILGIKKNMSSTFTRGGILTPVTFVVAEPNVVIKQINDKVLVGMGRKKKSKKTENAFIKTVGYTPRHIKEIKLKTAVSPSSAEESQEKSKLEKNITVSIFEPGDEVKVTGITKGKGFAGGVKRHGFAGGPKTHGQSDRHRAPGSIGAGTTPGRVYKGKRMAGHMGAVQRTTIGLEVIEVDEKNNILMIKGAIPGATNGFVIVEKTGKVKGYTPPPPPNEEKQDEKQAKAEEEAKAEAKEAQEELSDEKSNEKEEQKTEKPSQPPEPSEKEEVNA